MTQLWVLYLGGQYRNMIRWIRSILTTIIRALRRVFDRTRSILTTTIWIVLRALNLFNERTSSLDDGVSRFVVRLVDPLLFVDDDVRVHHIREEVIISKVSPAVRFVWVGVLTAWIIDAASGYEIPAVVYAQTVSGSGGIVLATATVMRARASTRDEIVRDARERVRFPVNRIRRREYVAARSVIAAFGATILFAGFIMTTLVIAVPVLFEIPALLTVERANALLIIVLLMTGLGADLRDVFTGYVAWVTITLFIVSALTLLVNRLVGPGWASALLLAQLVMVVLVSLFIFGHVLYGLLSELVGVLSSKSIYES